MLDMWATTNFARNRSVWVTNCIDGEFLWILIPELAMSLQGIARISFVIFVMNDWKVGLNPLIDLRLDLGNFFWRHFVVEIKVKADAFGGNIGPLLADTCIDMLLQSRKK